MTEHIERRQRRLKQASWTGVILAFSWFPVAFILYAVATVSCLGPGESTGLCDTFRAVPWLGLVAAIGLYLFALWLLHEQAHEELRRAEREPARLHWSHARRGYMTLQPGHHRLVRRLHHVAAVSFAMMTAWVVFMFMEADTFATVATGIGTYLVIRYFNWRTYPETLQREQAAALKEDETRTRAMRRAVKP